MSNEVLKEFEEYRDELLDGLSGTQRKVTKTVLDNYINESIKQKRSAMNGYLAESGAVGSTTTGALSRYDRIFMPLQRRVTPALLSMELVGNQPMTGPTGLVRTLRFRYSQEGLETTGGPAAGTEASGENVFEKYSLIAVGQGYDQEYDYGDEYEQTLAQEGTGGQPMNADISNFTVTAQTRKLQAVWSIEAEQDANSLDDIDLETEMVATLFDEVTREKDREMLNELTDLAGTVENFDFLNADGRYAGEKYNAITIGLSSISNQIAVKTRRGGATWMVVSPNVLTALRHADNASFTPATASAEVGPRDSLFVGTFNGNVRVFQDIYATTDYALLGYKGSSELDTGFVYCPYIPAMASEKVYDPNSFDPRISVMSRYAWAKFVEDEHNLGNSADFYGRATISNLHMGFTS